MDPKGTDIVPDEKLRLQIAFSNPLPEPFKLSIVTAVAAVCLKLIASLDVIGGRLV